MPKQVNAVYKWISPNPVKVGSTLLVVKLILPYSSHNLQGWITNFLMGFYAYLYGNFLRTQTRSRTPKSGIKQHLHNTWETSRRQEIGEKSLRLEVGQKVNKHQSRPNKSRAPQQLKLSLIANQLFSDIKLLLTDSNHNLQHWIYHFFMSFYVYMYGFFSVSAAMVKIS